MLFYTCTKTRQDSSDGKSSINWYAFV